MRIDLHSKTPQAADSEKPTRHAASAPPSAASTRPELGSDEARLSLEHTRVQSLVASAHRLPEVRQEKVDALQRAVDNGGYNVSSEQVAEAMFAEMQARSGPIR
jgi:flagellar biosynthesis anti-sigma factor FlgM